MAEGVWASRLFGGLFGTVGLGVILFFPGKGTMKCTPEPPICVIDRGSLALPETISLKRDDIRVVDVQESEGEDGPTWRPVFVLKNGTVEPWVQSYSNTGEFERWADQVATWLETPKGELTISADLGWLLWLIGLPFMLIGGVTLLASERGD
jgi:hypothetical protein